jgi:hypothetical protein
MIVAANEGVKDEFVDALGLSVGAYARVEVGGTALDDHDRGVRIGLLSVAGARGASEEKEKT